MSGDNGRWMEVLYIIKKADPPQGGAPQLLTPERSAVSFNCVVISMGPT